MKFKFHWGWAIAIFYTSFVVAMVYFVIYSKSVDHALVRDNYYDYDIGYEELIGEKQRNSRALKFPVGIDYIKEKDLIKVSFPKDINTVTGEIWLYRVNNERLDKKIEIDLDSTNTQIVNIRDFAGGKWKVNVEWVGDGKTFLDSKEIYMN